MVSGKIRGHARILVPKPMPASERTLSELVPWNDTKHKGAHRGHQCSTNRERTKDRPGQPRVCKKWMNTSPAKMPRKPVQ